MTTAEYQEFLADGGYRRQLLRLDNGWARVQEEGWQSRSPKSLPSLYFCDAEGSRLFQRITELEEYYLTRCEAEILETTIFERSAWKAGW